MAYSSVTAILIVCPGMADTSTVSEVISRHIVRADAVIDGKLSKRYSVPFSPTPPMLAVLSEDIATYYTYKTYYRNDNTNRLEDQKEIYTEAMVILDEIRDGKIDLVNTAGSVIAENTVDTETGVLDSTTKDYQPMFDVDSELNWSFDSDLIDDIADKR